MNNPGLQEFHDARPFRPFVIHLTDGTGLVVEHPEFLARSPTGRTAILYGKGDSFEMIDLLHIMSISVGNGKNRRRRKNGKK